MNLYAHTCNIFNFCSNSPTSSLPNQQHLHVQKCRGSARRTFEARTGPQASAMQRPTAALLSEFLPRCPQQTMPATSHGRYHLHLQSCSGKPESSWRQEAPLLTRGRPVPTRSTAPSRQSSTSNCVNRYAHTVEHARSATAKLRQPIVMHL